MRFIAVFWVLCFCTAQTFCAPLFEFTTHRAGISFRPADTGTAVDGKIPGTERSGLELQRRPGCDSIEVWTEQRPKLPVADELEFTLKGFLTANHGVRNPVLRLKDAKGELIQSWTAPLPESGEFERKFIVSIPGWSKRTGSPVNTPVSFNSIYLACDKAAGDGKIFLESLEYQVKGELPKVCFVSDTPMNLLHSIGDTPQLRLENGGTEPSFISGGIRVFDADSNPVAAQELKGEIPPGGSLAVPLAGPFDRWGIWYADYDLATRNGLKLNGRLSFAKMPNAGKPAEQSFIFGVAGGTGPLGWKPHLALGVNGFRVNPGWNHIQPREDIWSWEGHDRTFADRNAAGFASLYILTPPPAWLADKDSDSKIFNPQVKVNQLLPERNALRTFLQRFATRYKGKVEFYVIGNEPDLVGFWNFSEEEYLKMLEISYRTIKAADPDALVMNGGISSLYSQTPKAAPENRRLHPTIMRRILKEGNIDIFNYHGHGPIHNYWGCLDEMRKEGILDKFPWYSGETGVSLRDSAGVLEPGKPINPITIRKKQAEIIHEKVSIAKALGARGYTLWVLWDLQNWPEDHPEKYGALEPDGQPNTVFPVYANVIRHLQATRPDRIFAEGGLFACGYTRNAGGYIVSCWNDDGNQPGRPVIFTGVTGAAEKIDLFGNITPLAVQEGVCTFVVTCEPCFLRFPSQSETPGFHTPLTGDMASISAGKNGSLKFKLKNPFNRKLTASLAFAYPEHLTGPATRSVVLAPKAETGVSIPIAAAPGFISLPQNPTGVRISLALGDSAPISFVYPVIGKIMLTREADEGAPQFVLDRADQVYSYAISGPEQDLIWRGPEDLSAEVRLAVKDRTFEIQVEVTDDIHIQPYTGNTVWNGDSMQIGLKLSSQPRAWHFILAMLPDGRPQVTCDSRGSGAFDWAAAAAELDLAVSRDEGAKLTRYRLNIPFDAIGLTPADAAEGFRFNLMVNDNDGPKRESCISVAPSLNTSKNDALYPVICFQ